MLLIVNFDANVNGAALAVLSEQIAGQLEEKTENCFVVAVTPTPLSLPDPSAAAPADAAPLRALELASSTTASITTTPNPIPALSHFGPIPALAPAPGSGQHRGGEYEQDEPLITIPTRVNLAWLKAHVATITGQGQWQAHYRFNPAQVNYNRLAEMVLASVGLRDRDEPLGWQDAGPVVIIPPLHPALSMFLGHAISHYLQEAIWSPLYVVSHRQPLTLTEWD